ncbi:MAG: FG-GAP-like repeat-containing protein [Planctomycetota bacterium]|nr:FG-GAP-like repeat-containing protein [Planctomycetota bacterium]
MVRFGMPIVAAVGLSTLPVNGQWVVFNEDPSRLSAPAEVGAADTQEKDYAWGDVDCDGDIDLVVVRKEPWTTTGKRPNVLLINEAGVLTDRTADFASDSDVAGDKGFLTPTNDRDVVLVDVNGDGWLDIVTAVTLTDNQAKHLSHPRVYINKGEIGGAWQGFRYEDDRIPQMHPTAGPRFCAVSAGDVTGDGAPDLFFSDYDDGGTQIFDFNDRLLINDGNGFFTDETAARLTPQMYISVFGIANAIVDMNGDGVKDIVRLTANGEPYHIGVAYNNPAGQGFFNLYDQIYNLSAYHSAVGDLNGDGRMDVVAIDDGVDRYLLNEGNDAQGMADFSNSVFPPQTGILHAGNVVIEDLDKDGWNDVIIADVDVTLPGCSDRTFIFHNLCNGPNVSFLEDGQVIPFDMLAGVHDVAAFDIDDNGWIDLVIGRCTGTQIWMNEPPVGVVFSYPGGLPDLIDAGEVTVFEVQLDPFGETIVPGSSAIHVSQNESPFVETPLTELGEILYRAALPAGVCADRFDFYLSTELTGGLTFTDPPSAPAVTYRAVATSDPEVLISDSIEGDVSGWTIVNDPSLTAGAWEQAEPNVTIYGNGIAAPGEDATPDGTMAFVTENGPPGGDASSSDVDGGPTYLRSPVIDLDGTDALVTYARWAFTALGAPDALTVEVSNDAGDNWTLVESVLDTAGAWETASFFVGDYVTPTSGVQLRFGICDCPNDSVTEAGIDDFEVTVICGTACAADLDGNGSVGILDLLVLLSAWGTNPGHPADFDGDGTVGILDLLALLANWGRCP